MITVRLKGGLGNQMFEYAAGRALALKNKTGLELDISYFGFKLPGITRRSYSLDAFNIQAKLIKTSFLKFIIHKIFDRKKYDEYFQSPKYFEGHENVIRKDFTLKESLMGESKDLLEEIKNQNSVGVHARRGDYVNNSLHPTLDVDYYNRGIEYISQKSKIDKIYIFSDDIEWCKENLKFPCSTTFVGHEYSGKFGEGHMVLMSACKNFIIANSSFSWWAAWLSSNRDKIVVAPQKWFNGSKIDTRDLIPSSWIRI